MTNPVLLEIRRERAIELVAEGLRFSDLCRWKCGELIATLPWMGIHIDALNTDVDLNGDGIFDCYFTNNGTSSSTKDCLTVNVKNTTEYALRRMIGEGMICNTIRGKATVIGTRTTDSIFIRFRHKSFVIMKVPVTNFLRIRIGTKQ